MSKRLIHALLLLLLVPAALTISLFYMSLLLQPKPLSISADVPTETIYLDPDQRYALQGEMLFYPGVILGRSDFAEINSPDSYNEFVAQLSSVYPDSKKITALSQIRCDESLNDGFYDATLLFTLKMSGVYDYAIITPEGFCDMTVYVNGQLCATSAKATGSMSVPYSQLADFPSDEDGFYVVMITIHTPENYIVDISDTILFGSVDTIQRVYHDLRLSAVCLLGFILFCLSFFVIHTLALKFFKPVRMIVLLLLSFLLYVLTQDCGSLYEIHSVIPYQYGLVIHGLATPIFMVMLVLLTYAMFPTQISKKVWLSLLAVQIIPLVNVLCLGKIQILDLTAGFVQAIPYAQCMYIFAISYEKKVKHALLYGLSVLLIETGSLLSYSTRNLAVPVRFSSSFGIIAMTVVLVIILSSKYAEQAKIESYYKEELSQKLAEKQAAENAFLNAQMKPHFLYNTLNTIADCCVTDSPKAKSLINSLSEYLKLVLSLDNMEETVPLARELELAEAYSSIEKERFPSINFYKDFPFRLPNITMPPITIQPLIENAIKHGVRKLDKPGIITLRIQDEEDKVTFYVSDNGTGMTAETIAKLFERPKENKSIGIYNIDKRLKNLYGKGLSVESTPGLGTCVSFSIPKAIKKH